MSAAQEGNTKAPDLAATLPPPRAHVGMIIPAVNRVCEPQFVHFAPRTIGFHFERARIAGKWSRPIDELAPEIVRATTFLAECGPDLLVYNCTASSMKEGPQGERRIIGIMRDAAGIDAISTSEMVCEALRALGVRSVVVISPYQDNDDIIAYLRAISIEATHSVALKLPPIEFDKVTPQRWLEIAVANDRPNADAIFLSCAATTQIEAVDAIERALNKPVVNSNQAVLWGCLKRLMPRLEADVRIPQIGQLMRTLKS
jgi:maleate cis-trans isomerase